MPYCRLIKNILSNGARKISCFLGSYKSKSELLFFMKGKVLISFWVFL